MRLTDFWERLDSVLGPGYARSWAHDHVMTGLEGRTVLEAIDAGIDTQTIWRVVHEELELPGSLR